MAPPSKKSGKSFGTDIKQEDVLQAVVLADSFNVRFAPITEKKPRALLPLVNVPLLDYTLQFLCSSGIQEVFVFCCSHSDQIKKHIQNSQWSCSTSPCSVTTIISEGCLSLGDALREIDARAMIRSDFVLISGDVVANIKLQEIIESHKKRREKQKSAVMTMVYKKSSPSHRSRCREDDIVIAVTPDEQQVLYYQRLKEQKAVYIPVEVFSENSTVLLRYDLLDTHISVCSVLVPQLFTDNFDFQTSDDLVHGLLVDEDIHGNTVHIHEVFDEYAARISNVHMYDAVSRDIISRWTYPLVPDVNISSTSSEPVSYGRHNIYKGTDVTLGRGCILEENVVIGTASSISCDTTISNSVIGKNCKIGKNVRIVDAYIWDSVTIGDGCSVQKSILCNDVVLSNAVNIKPGCIVSWKVKLGPDVSVAPGCLLVSEPNVEFDDEAERLKTNTKRFGSQAQAFPYSPSSADSDDEDDELLRDIWDLGLWTHSDDDVSESSEMSESSGEMSDTGSPIPDEGKLFYSEVLDTLTRAKEENINTDNVILEINSLKHAYNINISDVNRMVMKALCEFPLTQTPDLDSVKYLQALKSYLGKSVSLMKNYIRNKDSQLHCMQALEEFCLVNNTMMSSVVKVIHHLYDADILLEQVILSWHQTIPESESDEVHAKREAIRKTVLPLIQWLQEAEEESDDDDNDSA